MESNVEVYYLNALCRTANMHEATAKNTLLALKELFDGTNRREDAKLLGKIATLNDFDWYTNVTVPGGPRFHGGSGSGSGGPKRVAFVIDYSGPDN